MRIVVTLGRRILTGRDPEVLEILCILMWEVITWIPTYVKVIELYI